MPPRPALLELGRRNFICLACRTALRKRPTTTTPWPPIRHSSHTATTAAPSGSKRRSPEEDAERLKALKALGLAKDEPHQMTVNYFQQTDSGELRRFESEDQFNQEFSDPGGELDAHLKALEDQIKNVRDLAKTIEDMGGKEEVDKLQEQLSRHSGNSADELPATTDELPLASLAIPIRGLNGNRQDRIHRLNNWLRRCVRVRDRNRILPKDVQGLWKSYSAARTILSDRWDTVPAPTWEVLWQVLSAEYAFSTTRMTHVYALARDMHNAGLTLRPEQQILALEAMFVDGWQKEAIENHRRHVSTLGTNPDTFLAFWQLGLQMYCRTGDLERARRIASTILQSPHEVDPRFIQPLIKLCAETPAAVQIGFNLYRDLRDSLGESMAIEDYDTIISYFLTTGNTEHALFIFVDMMKSGTVDLVGAQHYPPSIANPFFFGKWLKRLIGHGDLHGAYNVLSLQRSQGITPRAIQVNGLIGAWFRSGTAKHAKQAEEVAWAMINTRIQFVKMRKRNTSIPAVNLYQAGDGWPRANLETVSLLAENYKQRGLLDKMGPLWEAISATEIAPDSFVINQLLLSLIQAGRSEAVATTYEELFARFDLEPDSRTFMALWQGLPANRLARVPPRDLEAQAQQSRALFADMVKHASIFRTPDGMNIDGFLARTILHSFRKIQDRAGILLALRGLRRIFKYNPPDMVVFELLIETMDLENVVKRGEGIKIMGAQTSLQHYLSYKKADLLRSGKLQEGQEMSPELRAEETGNFLELQLQTAFDDMEETQALQLAIEAADAMGLRSQAAQDIEAEAQPTQDPEAKIDQDAKTRAAQDTETRTST
ncbi:hypothetical protein F4808DRAFT_176980 [Astrocystis sublimbata]|nr:hypothetical protein F4808DRAFT_176980 [Astrocystis sublimbata]